MGKYVIEKDVPIPGRKEVEWRKELDETLQQLEVDDSFWCEKDPYPFSTFGYAVFYAVPEARIEDIAFGCNLTVIEGWRVWRIN